MRISDNELTEFVHPYYQTKDELHGLPHIERILKLALRIGQIEKQTFDLDRLRLGAYFHGFVYHDEIRIRHYLRAHQYTPQEIDKIVAVAWQSQKESTPSTVEGKLLHDAHLLEGGETFIITKSLVVGTARGQSLKETLDYIRREVLGKYRCAYESSQVEYAKKEAFASVFLAKLEESL